VNVLNRAHLQLHDDSGPRSFEDYEWRRWEVTEEQVEDGFPPWLMFTREADVRVLPPGLYPTTWRALDRGEFVRLLAVAWRLV
jgi:hypothetical protein